MVASSLYPRNIDIKPAIVTADVFYVVSSMVTFTRSQSTKTQYCIQMPYYLGNSIAQG
jgi:hypothetical protein